MIPVNHARRPRRQYTKEWWIIKFLNFKESSFFLILKQILKNVINIPNDMWFERKATILALIQKWNIVFTKVCDKFYILNLEAFNFRYNCQALRNQYLTLLQADLLTPLHISSSATTMQEMQFQRPQIQSFSGGIMLRIVTYKLLSCPPPKKKRKFLAAPLISLWMDSVCLSSHKNIPCS
jgi:hypothetical protein